jgi:hypothetical protein
VEASVEARKARHNGVGDLIIYKARRLNKLLVCRFTSELHWKRNKRMPTPPFQRVNMPVGGASIDRFVLDEFMKRSQVCVPTFGD